MKLDQGDAFKISMFDGKAVSDFKRHLACLITEMRYLATRLDDPNSPLNEEHRIRLELLLIQRIWDLISAVGEVESIVSVAFSTNRKDFSYFVHSMVYTLNDEYSRLAGRLKEIESSRDR